MTTKLKIPKIRFKEFSWEWEEKKWEKLWEFRWWWTPTTKEREFWKGDILWISSSDLLENSIYKINESKFITKRAIEKSATKVIPKNSVIIVSRVWVWKIAINQKDLCTSQDFTNLIPNSSNSNVFLAYLFKNITKKLIQFNQWTSIKWFTTWELKNIKLNLPSLPEQQKIASFLSSVDEKIEKIKEKKKNLEEYKKWVMQKIFSQELRFKDENWKDFGVWEEKKLGEIWDFQTSSIDKITRDWENEVYLVNYMNVYRHESINNSNKDKLQIVTAKDSQILSNNLKKLDILFTPSSETPDDIWHSVVIFEDLDNCVYSYHLMRFRPKIQLNILYSHYFCNIPEILNQLAKLSTWSTRFTISVKSFSSIKVNLPTLKEQEKIADFLSGIDEKIEKVWEKLAKMEEFKKGLLQGMFV